MIDYIFTFPDEATAHACLDPLGFGLDGTWDGSRTLPVQIIVGYTDLGQDEFGNVLKAPVFAQGYWFVVSVPTARDDIYAVPYCMREANRELAVNGKPYVIRERFTAEQLAVEWEVTPQYLGADYSN